MNECIKILSQSVVCMAGLIEGGRKSATSKSVIIGVAVGVCCLLLLLVVVGVYAVRQKRIAKSASKRSEPFGRN